MLKKSKLIRCPMIYYLFSDEMKTGQSMKLSLADMLDKSNLSPLLL